MYSDNGSAKNRATEPLFGATATPLVSVITPVYNGSRYLDELIESVVQQDYPNIEHIVIDDGSTDGGATRRVLERWPQLRWWTRSNRGQYATQNEGIAAARGQVFTVIAADDFYAHRSAIGNAIQAWREHPQWNGVYGATLHCDAAGREWPVQPVIGLPLSILPYYLFVAHCSLFVSVDFVRSKGLWFDESLRFQGDRDWILRLLQGNLRLGCSRSVVAAYRHHETQATATRSDADRLREQRIIDQRHRVRPMVRHAVTSSVKVAALFSVLRRRGVATASRLVGDQLRRRRSA